jgi:hypothetical protein
MRCAKGELAMDCDPGDRVRVRVNYDYTITPSED